jgi:putative redox protein
MADIVVESPPVRTAVLRATGRGLVFEGQGGASPPILIDGSSEEGPSPMEALLLSLAGCMAIDIQVILEKSRVEISALEVRLTAERAPEPPKRFTRALMEIELSGPTASDRGKVERAVELSRDRYCSVFHTLRSDLEVEIRIEIEGA